MTILFRKVYFLFIHIFLALFHFYFVINISKYSYLLIYNILRSVIFLLLLFNSLYKRNVLVCSFNKYAPFLAFYILYYFETKLLLTYEARSERIRFRKSIKWKFIYFWRESHNFYLNKSIDKQNSFYETILQRTSNKPVEISLIVQRKNRKRRWMDI